jgi:hypothetical protein
MEVSGQLQAPAALPPGIDPPHQVPLDRKLGGSQIRFGLGGEEKNFHPQPGLEPPIIQPIAQRYTAEPCRLSLLATLSLVERTGLTSGRLPTLVLMLLFLDQMGYTKPSARVFGTAGVLIMYSRGWEFFSSPPRPELLWGPPSLLSKGYRGFFPWG